MEMVRCIEGISNLMVLNYISMIFYGYKKMKVMWFCRGNTKVENEIYGISS